MALVWRKISFFWGTVKKPVPCRPAANCLGHQGAELLSCSASQVLTLANFNLLIAVLFQSLLSFDLGA